MRRRRGGRAIRSATRAMGQAVDLSFGLPCPDYHCGDLGTSMFAVVHAMDASTERPLGPDHGCELYTFCTCIICEKSRAALCEECSFSKTNHVTALANLRGAKSVERYL